MKKFSKVAIFLLIFTLVASVFVACEKGNPVTKIYINSEDMPVRTAFVQGQELDLFGGWLSVERKDGSISKIALDSHLIKVTGYNSNNIESQTVTLSYGGKSTTLKIDVVAHIALTRDVIRTYFINEKLDLSKGNIVVTADDGTAVTVPINDPDVKIEVTGKENDEEIVFTEPAENVKAKISYNGISDEFSINVYKAENVSLLRPNIAIYYSHQDSMDLTGGFIRFKNARAVSDPTYDAGIKDVQITNDMVEGFDTSIATYEDNRLRPASQKVTFNYAKQSFDFTISIYFSDVSVIKYYDTLLSQIDWNADEGVQLTEQQKEWAVESAELYFADDKDKGYVTKDFITIEEKENIAKVAGQTAYLNWGQIMTTKYKDVFYYNGSYAMLILNPASPEIASAAYTELNNPTAESDAAKMNYWNDLLWKILNDSDMAAAVMFDEERDPETDEVISRAYTVREALSGAAPKAQVDYLIEELGFSVQLFNALGGVTLDSFSPGEYTYQSGEKVNDPHGSNPDATVSQKIVNTYNLIVSSKFVTDRTFFMLMQAWQPDFYHVLYQYYWNRTRLNDNNAWEAMIELGYYTVFPGPIEDFYTASASALEIFMSDVAYENVLDASEFIYYYTKSHQLQDQLIEIASSVNTVAAAEDEDTTSKEVKNVDYLYKALYEEGGFAYTSIIGSDGQFDIQYAVEVMDKLEDAYKFYNSMAYGYEEHEILINDYYAPLICAYMDSQVTGEPYLNSPAFEEDFERFFNKFLDATPSAQINFLVTISIYDMLTFDYFSAPSNYLSGLFREYFIRYFRDEDDKVIDENLEQALSRLIYAYECSIRQDYSSFYDVEAFMTNFEAVDDMYVFGDLVITQENDPKGWFEKIYTKTQKIYDCYNSSNSRFEMEWPTTSDGTDWEKEFHDYAKELGYLYRIYYSAYYDGFFLTNAFFMHYDYVLNLRDAFLGKINSVENVADRERLLNNFYYGHHSFLFDDNGNSLKDNGNDITANLDQLFFEVRTFFYTAILFNKEYPGTYQGQKVILYGTNYDNGLYGEIYVPLFREAFDFLELRFKALYYEVDKNNYENNTRAYFDDILNDEHVAQFLSNFFSFTEGENGLFKPDGEVANDATTVWSMDQKLAFIIANTEANKDQKQLFQETLYQYYSFKLNIPYNSTNIVVRFVNLVVSYWLYQERLYYYSIDDSDLVKYAREYADALDKFSTEYNKYTGDKAAFHNAFGGEELVKKYMQTPTVTKPANPA